MQVMVPQESTGIVPTVQFVWHHLYLRDQAGFAVAVKFHVMTDMTGIMHVMSLYYLNLRDYAGKHSSTITSDSILE